MPLESSYLDFAYVTSAKDDEKCVCMYVIYIMYIFIYKVCLFYKSVIPVLTLYSQVPSSTDLLCSWGINKFRWLSLQTFRKLEYKYLSLP